MIENVIQVGDNNSWGPPGSIGYDSYLAIRNTTLPDNFRDVPAILYGASQSTSINKTGHRAALR